MKIGRSSRKKPGAAKRPSNPDSVRSSRNRRVLFELPPAKRRFADLDRPALAWRKIQIDMDLLASRVTAEEKTLLARRYPNRIASLSDPVAGDGLAEFTLLGLGEIGDESTVEVGGTAEGPILSDELGRYGELGRG